jgi:hypothetical protein
MQKKMCTKQGLGSGSALTGLKCKKFLFYICKNFFFDITGISHEKKILTGPQANRTEGKRKKKL